MRAKTLSIAVTVMTIAALSVVVGAAPASALLGTQTFTVACASPIGTQTQTVTFSDDAPTDVASSAVFPITFPGGSATLPNTALGGVVTIQSFTNLSSTYTVTGGTFVTGSAVLAGPTTNNGTPITETVTLGSGNSTITFGEPGPIAPGDLTTPDITVNVQAAPGPGTVTISATTLTTTANIGSTAPGTPVPVVCTIPANTLTTTNVAAAGPQTTVSAGPDVAGLAGSPITMNGSYADPFGTPTLLWTADSPDCTFADPTAAVTDITCTRAGTFAATLSANDGVNPTVSDLAQVVVTTPNVPPAVNAGPDVSGIVSDDIALNGTVTDPDNTPTIAWTVDTPDCSFSDPTSPATVINCTATGTFAATLTADDGVNPPVTDTAQVTISPIPPGLTVKAGPDVSGNVGAAITLQGKITDPGQTPIQFWSADSPSCTFADPNAVITTITCTVAGVYAATLTAGDGGVNPVTSDTALVTVIEPNAPAVVSAGPDVMGAINQAIALHGTVTDLSATPTITWSADSPNCSFANPNVADTTITCTGPGVFAASLVAADGLNPPVTDVALVTVLSNLPPTVSAGPDVSGLVTMPIALSGTVTDPDSTPTTLWSTGSTTCSFADPTAVVTTITCTAGGVVAATLTANDGVNPPVSDTTLVTVIAPNQPPTVTAGGNTTGILNHAVALHGVVTDPDSTPVVHWANGSPNCSFSNPNVADTTFTCTAPGTYAVTLTASDFVNSPVSDTAIVTISPQLCTGVCLAIGDAMTYEGGIVALPVTLNQPQLVKVTFTATIVPVPGPGGAINGTGLPVGAPYDFKTPVVHNMSIAAGARQAYVQVTAVNDNLLEGDETFDVVLSNPAGVSGISLGRSTGVATIKDATGIGPGHLLIGSSSIVEVDACGTCKVTAKFSVVLSAPSATTVSVKYSTQSPPPPDGATAGSDYTARSNVGLSFTTGTALYRVATVITIGDNTPEPTEGINFVFSSPVGAALDFGNLGRVDIIDND